MKPGRLSDEWTVEVRRLKDRRRMIKHSLNGNSLYTHLYRRDVAEVKLVEIDKRLVEIAQLRKNRCQKEGEEWLPVVGNPKYMVSNLGRVKTIYGHLMTPCFRGRDRVYLGLTLGGKSTTIHRAVAKAFIPNPNNLPEVNHKDLNKTNNRVDNLEWVSRRDNMEHAKKAGVIVHGSKHKYSKLTENDVIELRRLRSEGVSLTKLAVKYGMNTGQISRVANRIYWKHVL